MNWLSCGDTDFFFSNAYAEERTRRAGETKFSARVTVTAPTTMHAETARVFSETLRSASSKKEDWAAVSGSERIAPYSLDQSRVAAYTTGFSQASIFIPQSLQHVQRPHERRPMASKREQVSVLFFVAWTQRRLTECFPWATEGPNPPKETLTFKKEFFWQTSSGSLPAGLKLRLYN